MNDTTLLNQIGILIDEKLDKKLDEKLEPIKQDLNGVKQDISVMKQDISGIKEDQKSMKQDISGIKEDQKSMKQQLDTVELKVELVNKRVEQSQEETISALSEVINEGFNMHEKRIKKLEEASQSSHTH